MKKDNIPYNLIAKYMAGNSTKQESQELESWMNETDDNKAEFEKMKKINDINIQDNYTPDVEAALKKVKDKLPKQEPSKNMLLYQTLKVAGIFMLGAVLSFLAFPLLKSEKTIVVENNNAGSLPIEVELPDGSMLWLSHGSKINHPKKFKGPERRIYFEGEAYFDITRNEKKPFVIETEHTETTVLGTEFVLRASPLDKLVSLTVTEGKVSLKSRTQQNNSGLILTAGEKGTFNKKSRNFQESEAEISNAASLKTGILKFYKVPVANIIESIESQYNKELDIEVPNLDTVSYSMHFENLEFDQILENLEFSLGVEIERINGIYKIKEKL